MSEGHHRSRGASVSRLHSEEGRTPRRPTGRIKEAPRAGHKASPALAARTHSAEENRLNASCPQLGQQAAAPKPNLAAGRALAALAPSREGYVPPRPAGFISRWS